MVYPNISTEEKAKAMAAQVYDKAKRSYFTDNTFIEIKALYDRCNKDIQKSKKKGIIKLVLMLGWIPLMLVCEIIYFGISFLNSRSVMLYVVM